MYRKTHISRDIQKMNVEKRLQMLRARYSNTDWVKLNSG